MKDLGEEVPTLADPATQPKVGYSSRGMPSVGDICCCRLDTSTALRPEKTIKEGYREEMCFKLSLVRAACNINSSLGFLSSLDWSHSQEPSPTTVPENHTFDGRDSDKHHASSDIFVNMDFQDKFVQIINGKGAAGEKTRNGVNPATLEPKKPVPVATPDDLDRAVNAAKTALKDWSRTPYEKRRDAVLAFADAVESHKTSFRDLLVSEQGKPVSAQGYNERITKTH